MIEVIKTPEISLNECALCDSILVTYTLVGEEPVTVEVESVADEYTTDEFKILKDGTDWIVQATEATPISGCDCIVFNYQLTGESPQNLTLSPTGILFGKNKYEFSIGGVDYMIFWSTVNNSWKLINVLANIRQAELFEDTTCPFGDYTISLLSSFTSVSITQCTEFVTYATLSEDNPCPFGTYTIVEGSIFEAFEVAPVECYTSKWSAVHHPIKWELQRKDAEVISTGFGTGGFTGKFKLELSATPPTGVVVGLEIDFYDSLGVKRSGTILDVTGNFLIVSNNYILGVIVEFAIFPTLYNNYYIETQVENIGLIRTIPNPQGKATIDVSAWLRTQTAFENTYNYANLTALDLGQSGSYRLRFRENYNFQIGAFGSYTSKFYWSNSAKQIRDAYGSNMIEYVTNLNAPVKFLSVFNRPTNFIGFPFSLSWINGGDYTKLIRRNENNGTYTALGSITSGSGAVNRLKVSDACESVLIEYGIPDFFGAFLKQGELTETKQIKINQTCLERPLAVSWENTLGGREHWVFSYNQIHTLDTQSGATYQPNIDNLETATSNIFDLQKFAQPKISVGANVDIEDIEGLKSILYSICVEIQTAQGWIGVRPETGSFKILETKDTKATIEMTFVLPDINIQTR
jgi:hypothetical protein